MFARIARLMVLLCTVASLTAHAGEFTADLKQSVAGMDLNGKIFMKEKRTRTELNMKGHGVVMILDLDAKSMVSLMPEQKMAMKMVLPIDQGAGWAGSDEDIKKLGAVRTEVGKEKMGGYDCIKYSITFADTTKGTVIQWFSKELQVPIRIEYTSSHGAMVYELENIVVGAVDDSVFQVPSDYQVIDAAAMGIPPGLLPGK
jgi:outer membrane lipoprotein-sorting protein